jgi:hypothetical protein
VKAEIQFRRDDSGAQVRPQIVLSGETIGERQLLAEVRWAWDVDHDENSGTTTLTVRKID